MRSRDASGPFNPFVIWVFLSKFNKFCVSLEDQCDDVAFQQLEGIGVELVQFDDDVPPRQIRFWSRRQTVLVLNGDGDYVIFRFVGFSNVKP